MKPQSRREYLARQKAAGMMVAAVWPARFPVELLWAHGFCAAEVWDPPGERTLAPSHLPASACSIVTGGFELLASGGVGMADLLVFPHTCDSIQNLATLVKDLLGEGRPCLTFYPPKGQRGASAEAFVARQLRDLSSVLTEAGWPASEGSLEQAMALGRRRSALLAELYDGRAAGRLSLANADFYTAVRACEYMAPQDAVAVLESALEGQGEGGRGIPVVFTGVLPVPKDLPGQLDRMGLSIVEDDFLGCGRRFLRDPVPEDADPYREMARRLMALPPCPTQGASTADRFAFVEGLVERSRARGVVFLSMRSCEPDLFERPALVAGLKARGIPALVMETETGAATPAGALTRLEAFQEVVA